MVRSLIDESKVGLQQTQPIPTWESFPNPTSDTTTIGLDTWAHIPG